MFGEDAFGQDPVASEPGTTAATPVFPKSRLFHPSMRKALGDLFPSTCTIQIVSLDSSPSGQRVPSQGVPVAGLTNLPCRLGAREQGQITDSEIRTGAVTEKYTRRTLQLSAYYPSIISRQMRAVVDGVVYPIRGVESDSEKCYTRLFLEVIDPKRVL